MEETNNYEYGVNDKPKGQAVIVPDEQLEVFPTENEEIDTSKQALAD